MLPLHLGIDTWQTEILEVLPAGIPDRHSETNQEVVRLSSGDTHHVLCADVRDDGSVHGVR